MKPILKDLQFKKSSFSGSGSGSGSGCVNVAICDEVIYVRDTKDPKNITLTFNKKEWIAFIAGVKNNEFDIP